MAIVVESVGDFSSNTSGSTVAIDMPAGVVEGDLLIAHLATSVGTQWDLTGAPGFTSIRTVSHSDVGTIYVAVAYKVATASDAIASSLTFTNNGAGNKGGRIYRISGQDTSSPIGASNSSENSGSSTVTVSTITPAAANSLIMILTACDSGSTGSTVTTSAQQIATDNPSFSENYDNDQGEFQIAGASAVRTPATATGNGTATLSGTFPNAGVMLAITPQTLNVNATPAVVEISAAIQAPTVSAGANVSPAVVDLNASVQAPTITAEGAKWSNQSKNSTSWSNQSKS